MQHKGRAVRVQLGVLLFAWLGFFAAPAAHADFTTTGEKWVDTLKFGGDLRLRHESIYYKQTGTGTNDRNRERFRFRWGGIATIQDWTGGFRLASGVGQAVSTNQTYTNSFTEKNIWIDQAYIGWKPQEYVKLWGGKMPNPIWRTYASDIMWDPDINPEGYAQQLDFPAGDRLALFANFGQFPLYEKTTVADAWMFANQIGARMKVSEGTRLTVAGAFYGFENEKAADFLAANGDSVGGAIQQGNARTGANTSTSGQLATDLKLLHFTSELAAHVGAMPISLQGDYVQNTADTQNVGRVGYQTGFILGKAKDQGTWEFAYFWKYAQFNSSYADLADSDFGNGGLNRKGHIMWIGYALRDYVTLTGKYFITDPINPFIQRNGSTGAFNGSGGNGPSNRFQMDLVLKF